MCRVCLLSFPSTAGARLIISLKRRALAPLAWLRAYARGAVAPSGPLRSPARRPFEIAPRRPAVPPATSWPDLPGLVPGIRPSIGPRTREEAWRREMPGTSPGMTRRVGRSDGSHPQGRRRPQPAPPLHQPFLIPQAPGTHVVLPRAFRATFACLRAIRRAARSRASGPAARTPLITNASSGAARGVCYQGVRAAGPERATARRAEWRVGKRAELAPAVEGNAPGA